MRQDAFSLSLKDAPQAKNFEQAYRYPKKLLLKARNGTAAQLGFTLEMTQYQATGFLVNAMEMSGKSLTTPLR